jgi:hypothetical protein
MKSELLAPSAFCQGFYKSNPIYAPNGWRSRHARSVPGVSCADAEEQAPDYDFGQTASAGSLAVNPSPWTTGDQIDQALLLELVSRVQGISIPYPCSG